MAGDQGRDAARRRFGDRARTLTPAPSLVEREFTLDDLMEPGGRGLAQAAQRQGNKSAARALADLARSIRQLDDDNGGDAA